MTPAVPPIVDEWTEVHYGTTTTPRPSAKASLLEKLDRFENLAGGMVPASVVRKWIQEVCK